MSPILLVLGATSLRADQADGRDYFERHVRPVLVEHCYECHAVHTHSASNESNAKNSNSKAIEGGLRLDHRQGWSEGGNSGPAIVPGDPDASLLIRAVRYTDEHLQMPPDAPLPPDVVARLEHWVRIGAPDPREADPAEDRVAHELASDPVAGRNHWAFRPLASPTVPRVHNSEWPRGDIDRFVLARLEEAGLQPATDATRRAWARRVFYQLTGLPPTRAEMDAFLADESPAAAERLVDRLLSSPSFGQRWGRHWLDLARYADSNGLDENFLFREAWRYRNWVIDAVNDDMPFDRFLLEQIAGDLLEYESLDQRDRQRIAAGFMVVGPKVLLGNDDRRQRLEVADEQLDTIGRAVLGMTLGCARCHDHKFDPIPTADYYALAGILTSTTVMERRYMLGEQRLMERLVGLGADGDQLDQQYEAYWRERPQLQARRDRANAALELLKSGDADGFAKQLGEHADTIAPEAAAADQPMDKRIEAQNALIAQLDARLSSPPPIPPRAMIPTDAEQPADESIRLAGQFDRPGRSVPRGFLQVVTAQTEASIPQDRSGRLELARWLTDCRGGAGHLAARVLANRIWHHLIGRGIVATTDNFGRTGETPTHPELLDYLALQLIESNWSIKSLVRQVVLSRTFGISSEGNASAELIDPDNHLLWRAHRRRLDAESLRDSLLAVSGLLDPAPMESTVWYLGDQATGVGKNVRRRTDFPCRSVYLPVIRNDLPELFEVFDFANPHAATGSRPQTTVASQGLFMLNDPLMLKAAETIAASCVAEHPVPRAAAVWETIFGERPSEPEAREIAEFAERVRERLAAEGDADAPNHAWVAVCHALLASSRLQFLE